MIYEGSRYRNVLVRPFVNETDGSESRYLEVIPTTYREPRTTNYTVKVGDTFETLAYRECGRSVKWYALAMLNADVVFWPLDLEPGMVIRLPPRDFYDSV